MGQNKSILGYSEGATTAATLILEEQRLFREQGRPRCIKVRGPIPSLPPLKTFSSPLI